MDTTCKLRLYSTSSCHLCELAVEIVNPWLERGWVLEEVDIADDENLFAQYGLTIPVLQKTEGGAELNWPFDENQLSVFLARSD